MIAREDIVTEARTWLGTPWQHQGRLRGVGVDCIGLAVGVARAFGLEVQDRRGYARRPLRGLLQQACEERLERVRVDAADAGDVLLFSFEHWPGHLALLTGPETLIHAYMPHRKVTEHRLDAWWWSHVTAAYRIPGVGQ